MNFFRKYSKNKSPQLPAYSNFEEGDIFYTKTKGVYSFFKVLGVDIDYGALHVLVYKDMKKLPAQNEESKLNIFIYHAPIAIDGFDNPQLYSKTSLKPSDLLGYQAYLEGTNSLDEIASIAVKYYQLAYGLSTRGEHRAAIEKYDLSIYMMPGFFEAIDNRAFCKMDLGLFNDAIDDFQLSLSVNPDSLLAVFSIGECYLKLNDFQKAKDYFEKALVIDPTHEKSKEFLNLTLALMNQKH